MTDRRFSITPALLFTILLLAAPRSAGQELPVLREVIDLEQNRPEAWAMNYFSAAIFPAPIETSAPGEPWTVRDLSLELGWLPELDLEQRTIGFDGLKEEDLNKLDVLPRPSIRIDLPLQLSLTAGWIPPLELEGVRASLVLLTLSRPVATMAGWKLHARVTGQRGTIDSDFTCPSTVAALPPGPGNPWGCEQTSADSYEITQGGAEAVAVRKLATFGSPTVQFSAAYLYTDAEFQVDAIRTGFRDLTLLRAETDGFIASAAAFWSLPAHPLDIGAVGVWAPIDVRRPGGIATDPFFNLRIVAIHRW